MAAQKRSATTGATSKAEKEADLVMGTNNSSIVSKRSVEMSYYPEPHFFRYFVKKPQRRAPLINRGYWLRMHTISETVRRFVKEPGDRPKYILNLGCGFDPLPFQLLSAQHDDCNARFVDIDYEKLMVNKKAAIRKTNQITGLLKDVEFLADDNATQIRSAQYIAIGCDLKNLTKLSSALEAEIQPSQCSILCLAEVSLTYMDVGSANAVIRWAAQLSNDVQFCILEQFFPDGPDHPFAATMMKHFNKLGAPLFSIHEYPSLREQEIRFTEAGWTQVRARSLWDLWSDGQFVSPVLRRWLDDVEPFDEWEEFALFASHYFVLLASTRQGDGQDGLYQDPVSDGARKSSVHIFKMLPQRQPHSALRRYGVLFPSSEGSVGHHGGLGRQSRLASTDVYSCSSDESNPKLCLPPRYMRPRMCHTVTSLSNGDCLLIGGRASPNCAYGDCWLKQGNRWSAVQNLPSPRFRHSATNVHLGTGSEHVLVYGGKSIKGEVLDTWLVWNAEFGWKPVEQPEIRPPARFGACLQSLHSESGILLGGIGQDGVIFEDLWTWTLGQRADGSIFVRPMNQTPKLISEIQSNYLFRFGATINRTSHGVVVIGGVIPRRILPHNKEIVLVDNWESIISPKPRDERCALKISDLNLDADYRRQRPLLTGHASCTLNPEEVLIVGGGAVCFSFGTFWNTDTWLLTRDHSTIENTWSLVPETTVSEQDASNTLRRDQEGSRVIGTDIKSTTRVRVETAEEFERIVTTGQPVVIEGADIGPCTDRWTKEYLINAVGSDRKIVVHEAQTEHMDFHAKNFSYSTKEFSTFLNELYAGGRQYLRSISAAKPSKVPSNLAEDFPALKKDFRLPEQMSLVVTNAHSSPLRISGSVNMWLHYDVMANVLCQIRGNRRLILYPPSDVRYFQIPAGTSSSSIHIFQNLADGPILSIPNTTPYEALLKPGDILFIPPLWLHTASSTAGEASIAVNVFFRNLDKGYSPRRDVYGNRDLQAYEQARIDLQRIEKSFDGLPSDMARFYLLRLAQELKDIAES